MTTGNYIHDLQMTVRVQAQALHDAQEAYDNLVTYLYSPKFYYDKTVQVQDVLNRISFIKSAILDGTDDPLVKRLTKPAIVQGEELANL